MRLTEAPMGLALGKGESDSDKDLREHKDSVSPEPWHHNVAAQEVSYGHKGVSGFFSSPFVFGVALLASIGGFSYGYGRSLCHRAAWPPDTLPQLTIL